MHRAGQHLFARERGRELAPRLQKRQKFRRAVFAQQVECHGLPLAAAAGCARDLEYGGTGHALFRKLHLARAAREHLAALRERHARIGAHALECARIGRLGRQLHERGVQRRAPVTEALQQGVAVAHAAGLRPGDAAARDDDALGGKLPALRLDDEAAPLSAHGRHGVARVQGDVRLRERKAQHVHDAVGRVRERVHAPARLGHGQKTVRGEPVERRCGRKGRECARGKLRLRAVVVFGRGTGVRQVAAAVSGHGELASHARLPLKEQDLIFRGFGGGQRGHHAGRARADDCDRHGDAPFLS